MTTMICFGALSMACAWLVWTDIRFGIIPDWINALVALLGVTRAFAMDGLHGAALAGIGGLIVGVLLLLLRRFYFAWRGVQGLGLGDVKFLAAAVIWTGLAGFPVLLLIATFTALLLIGLLRLTGHAVTARSSIPFGPALSFSLLVTLLVQPVVI
jgi:leader peptidase (prepilin peptidase) / N-methyltransferase